MTEIKWLTLHCLSLWGWCKKKPREGDAYIEKAFTWRFVLWLLKVSQTLTQSENKATVDVHWEYVSVKPVLYLYIRLFIGYLIHILCVGFCVARPRLSGQCETPWVAGRVTSTDSHAFLYMRKHIILILPFWGAERQQKKEQWKNLCFSFVCCSVRPPFMRSSAEVVRAQRMTRIWLLMDGNFMTC